MKAIPVKCRRAAFLCVIAGWIISLAAPAYGQKLDIEGEKVIQSGRPDGRHVSTRGFLQHLLRNADPVVSGNRITTGFWNAGSRGRFWFARSLRGFGWVFHGNASITFSLRRCSQSLRPGIPPWLPRKALPPPAWSVV